MGISIYCREDESIKCNMAYSTFARIRIMIAYAYNPLLGKLYESQIGAFNQDSRTRNFRDIENIMKMSDSKTKRMIQFLETSDVRGAASGAKCRMLLEFKNKVRLSEIEKISWADIWECFWNVVLKSQECGIRWS